MLMFLLTWPIDLSNSGVLPIHVPFVIYLFLGWGFIFATLIMTSLALGKGAVVELLKRFLIWRTGWKWYLVALLLFPAIMISAVLLNAAFTRSPIDFSTVFAHKIFGPSANLPILILPYLVFEAIANGEEIGWRGYILPRLQTKYSAMISSLIIGIIWGLWHIPKFLAPGNASPFGLFMVKAIAESFLYTWLYNNTKGSLLLVTLFHAAGNTAGVFLPVTTTFTGINPTTLIIQIFFEILAVLAVIAAEGPARLSRIAPKQMQA